MAAGEGTRQSTRVLAMSSMAAIRRELPSIHAVHDRAIDTHARTHRSDANLIEAAIAPGRPSKSKTVRFSSETMEDTARRVAEALRRPAGIDPTEPGAGHPEPTADEIRERAYQIYLERGGTPGDPAADWLQAERELRAAYGG